MSLRAPFPWFGGKSRVADAVWRSFGDCPNYVEPFFGSGAVLLGRPTAAKIETVNDSDAMLCNFWRAITAAPDEVAAWCDYPVNETDLHARHAWLIGQLRGDFRERMRADPGVYDAQIAGWWAWGLSMWIGSGWCQASRVDRNAGEMPAANGRSAGMGVHRKRPDLGLQMPALMGGGKGINAPTRIPDLMGNQGIVNGQRGGRWADGAPVTDDGPPCLEWFRSLQTRLRRVRVCCGDWSRILTPSVTGTTNSRNSGMNPCAVFLDPPYSGDERAADLYSSDDGAISKRVADWAREHGGDKDLRIALCGYDSEHEMPSDWTAYRWTATRGYSGEGNNNRNRETVWFSPHCLPVEPRQRDLFISTTPTCTDETPQSKPSSA